MLEVRAVTAVERYGRPLIAQNFCFGSPRVHHRLNRQHHALGQLGALAFFAKVRNLWRFMQFRPNAVAYELPNYTEPVRFHVLLYRRPNMSNGVADLYLLDSLVQRSLGYFEQLFQLRSYRLAHRYRDGSVSVIALKNYAAVDGNDVSRFQRPLLRRDAMHDLFIDRSAEHTRITVITLERRSRSELANQLFGGLFQVHRRNARSYDALQMVQNLADHLPAPLHLLDLFRRLADDPVFSKTHNSINSLTASG